VLAAGRGNVALVRRAAGWEMPTFASFHQVPYMRNSPDNDFAQRRYAVGPPGAPREVELIDAPTIYPPGTSREELERQFRPAPEAGRLMELGAAGISIAGRRRTQGSSLASSARRGRRALA